MPTTMNDLWAAMERDAAGAQHAAGGWVLRLASPVAGCPLFAAIELTSRRRAVLLRMPIELVPPLRRWPHCNGLEPLKLVVEGVEHFGVVLKDANFTDVFIALAEDVAKRVLDATSPPSQVSAFFGQLSRWQKFLAAPRAGLTQEAQRGLWGELWCLREHLLPTLGLQAIAGWKGPEQAHQDFQFPSGAIEVKTTIATQPQVVRISGERQLDDKTWPTLLLHVAALDALDGNGESLPSMVASLRTKLAADLTAIDLFEDRLLLVGYLEAHVERYVGLGYRVRSETTFHVREGFPMLTERDLPPGLGDLSYGLSLAACEAFLLDPRSLKERLVELAAAAKDRNRRTND